MYTPRSSHVTSHLFLQICRLSDSGFCAIRRSRTTYGDRCFAAAGPRVWNSLPTELRQSDSLAQFKRRLKTHLFGLWDHSTLRQWLLVNWRYRNILTYLLHSLPLYCKPASYPPLQNKRLSPVILVNSHYRVRVLKANCSENCCCREGQPT